MSKLNQWLNALDNDETLDKLLNRLVTLSVSLFYFWAFLYFFVWS